MNVTEALGIPSAPANLECADPFPLEVPVRIRGLAGGGNLGADSAYEPFLEDTFTVLVSPRGAVLRLASYAAPGQMVTITSPRLGLELPARVVRYRGHADVKGYAEIEFTEREIEPPHATSEHDEEPLTAARPEPVSRLAAPTTHHLQMDSHCAPAAPSPIVLAPLADLLAETPSMAGAHAQRGESPSIRRTPRKPRSKAGNATAKAETTADLEVRLAARRAAEESQPSAQELAQRLLGTDEQDLLAAPRRPRKRWLAAAAAVLLTLGAAGTWGVVTAGVYAFGPLPKIAAFAPPEPPAIVARPLGVTVNGVAIEPEPARISTQLVDPYFLRPLVAPAPGVSQQRRAVVSELPEYELPSVTAAPSSAAQPGALDALAPRPVAPAKAPPKPVAAEPQRPVGGVVKPPRLIEQAPIAYPAMARAARVEGAVVIDARVDETGRVVQMRVVSGHALLHQAAQESLRHWRYEPGTLNGQPTAMHVYVTIQFRR